MDTLSIFHLTSIFFRFVSLYQETKDKVALIVNVTENEIEGVVPYKSVIYRVRYKINSNFQIVKYIYKKQLCDSRYKITNPIIITFANHVLIKKNPDLKNTCPKLKENCNIGQFRNIGLTEISDIKPYVWLSVIIALKYDTWVRHGFVYYSTLNLIWNDKIEISNDIDNDIIKINECILDCSDRWFYDYLKELL